jgi:hypothetical protein
MLVHTLSLDELLALVKQIDQTVTDIQDTYFDPHVTYAAFGTSFGTLLATYVAKNHQNIQSVILNMPYGKFSHLIWTYKPARTFKQKMLDKGIGSEEKLHELLLPIEPQHNLSKLATKRIVNFTALNDKVVFDGKEFEEAIKKSVPDAVLYQTQYGHFWGGIENILSKHKWESIL